MVTIEELLQIMVQRRGSDLHVTAGAPPKIRIDDKVMSSEHEMLTPDMTQKIVYSFLTSDQIARFERDLELDLSFGVDGLGRFRVNVFQQRGAVGAVLRMIPYEIKNFQQLGLPEDVCSGLCSLPRGLILVTGATGSGKSTTLASMINHINETEQCHIITIEDPIEFLHRNKQCLFNQREVGSDTRSFKNALRSVLRQDPDVVLIGEMRDQETIEAALTLAETGHLTFGTLHTSDAVQTINRIVDVFPAYQQQQIRTQLAFSLEGVFCQQLIPKAGGKGRCMAAEILITTPGIRALIRDDKAHQIYSQIQIGGRSGMCTMNQSLSLLIKAGSISLEDGMARSSDNADLKNLLARG